MEVGGHHLARGDKLKEKGIAISGEAPYFLRYRKQRFEKYDGAIRHDVEALPDHIYGPIAEIEIQYYLEIGPHKRDESRHHQHAGQRQADT